MKHLVIVTTHFGTNFSGGSLATCEIFSRIPELKITVIGTQLGQHPFKNLTFHRYRHYGQALKWIVHYKKMKSVFYGDFYNAFLLRLAGVPFYFTYHDNWPGLRVTGLNNWWTSQLYIQTYQYIFRKAIKVISVSDFQTVFIKKATARFEVIRNGFSRNNYANSGQRKGVLMVGNIDQRKYGLALKLFETLPKSFMPVDIYGNINDNSLGKRLQIFPFVTLKGFQHEIPFNRYQLLLHTSQMENLPLVFGEALYHRTPVLAFDVGGNREIVFPPFGALIEPYRMDALKHQLQMMIRSKEIPPEATHLKDYSWDSAALAYQQILFS
jgi:glycosyltransferase involved in cell wall biosynthesis